MESRLKSDEIECGLEGQESLDEGFVMGPLETVAAAAAFWRSFPDFLPLLSRVELLASGRENRETPDQKVARMTLFFRGGGNG